MEAGVHPVSVLIADDHEPYRRALEAVLASEPGVSVVGSAGNGADALDLIERLDPDVALVDVVMGSVDGFGVCSAVKERAATRTRVVLISAHRDPALVARGRASGAAGYVGKHASNAALRRCVRAVAAGADWFD